MFIFRATDEVAVMLTLRSCQAELAHHISAQYRLRAAAPIQTIDIEGIHHGIWDSSYSNLLGRGGGVRSDHLLLDCHTALLSPHFVAIWVLGWDKIRDTMWIDNPDSHKIL